MYFYVMILDSVGISSFASDYFLGLARWLLLVWSGHCLYCGRLSPGQVGKLGIESSRLQSFNRASDSGPHKST